MKITNIAPTGENNVPWECEIHDWKASMFLSELEEDDFDVGIIDASITLKHMERVNRLLSALQQIHHTRNTFKDLRTHDEIRKAMFVFEKARWVRSMYDDPVVKWLSIDTDMVGDARQLCKVIDSYRLNYLCAVRMAPRYYRFILDDISTYTFFQWKHYHICVMLDHSKGKHLYKDFGDYMRKLAYEIFQSFIEHDASHLIPIWSDIFCSETTDGVPIENCIESIKHLPCYQQILKQYT